MSASKAPSTGLFAGGLGAAFQGWKGTALFVLAVLVVLNVWRGATRDVGPDPEVEALHSAEEAVRICRDAVQSQLAARDPSIVDPGRPEYLQGGEYDVRLVVELDDGNFRTTEAVLCQAQFTAETGWIVEDVSLDPN